jgi:hypothetical protein
MKPSMVGRCCCTACTAASMEDRLRGNAALPSGSWEEFPEGVSRIGPLNRFGVAYHMQHESGGVRGKGDRY